jgi:hypothetical protein
MINITRGNKPTSLDRPEIQLYLDEVIKYNLLVKQGTKPAKEPDEGAYRKSDVLKAFDRDFHSKCYLTEQKFENSWAMDVEHFKSKSFSQYPLLKYDWQNLYPCSHDANISKPVIEPVGGYLDPCESGDDVEREIVYDLMFNGKANFGVLNKQNSKAVNTVNLLDKVHNGHDFDSTQKTATLRYFISKKSFELINLIGNWQNFKLNGQLIEEVRTELKLKEILSRKNEFTMLLRSLSSVKYLPDEFLD